MTGKDHVSSSAPSQSANVIPSPPGYPLLGHLPQMGRDPLTFLSESVRRYGDMVGLRMGRKQAYLLVHPDHVKHVLQDQHRLYHKDPRLAKLRLLLGNGLVTSEGELWLRQRRLMQPGFHRERLAALADAMTATTAEMLERWRASAASGAPLDIGAEMKRLTIAIVVRTMFSSQIGQEADVAGRAVVSINGYFNRQILSPIPIPDWLPLSGYRQFQQQRQALDDIVYRIIDERMRGGPDSPDIISMLLAARDEQDGTGMSAAQVRDELMTIFLAGYETTATTLTWVWYLLGTHPNVAERLRAELDTVLGGRCPTFDDLAKLTYTRMVIEETLRLYPPAWIVSRIPSDDDAIGGYSIPAGSIIFVSPYVTQRHPAYWGEDAGTFNPDHFAPERVAGQPRYAFFPFGGGPRQCIGNNFAMMEMQLVLAQAAQQYDLRALPGQSVTPLASLTLSPRQQILMSLHSRA